MLSDISLYCNCFKHQTPYDTQYNQTNLMLGSHYYPDIIKSVLKRNNYILDEDGENISDLNKWFGQTCGLYWTWKNSNNQFVGNNTYRIFWDKTYLQQVLSNDDNIYVVKSLNIKDYEGSNNVRDQYVISHGDFLLKYFEKFLQESNKTFLPHFYEWSVQTKLIPFNIFLAKKEIFDKICEILFDITLNFFYDYKHIIVTQTDHAREIRQLDFLSERILNSIYQNIDFYIPNVKILEVPVYQYQNK